MLDLISPYAERKAWVVIDEVQKAPALLDLVHQQISRKAFHFALTGSSARKLKRGGANLLAGRAFVLNLHPFTHLELGAEFELEQVLSFGALPEAILLPEIRDRRRLLKAYAGTYLQEEIVAEQLVRNLPPFRRFLNIVGRHTGEIVNASNIARDIDSNPKTVQRYYEILEDTLLGFHLPSFDRSIRRQQRKARRFYFFDTGVARVLAGRIDLPLLEGTSEFGQLFESFLVNEVRRLLDYNEQQYKLSFLRIGETREVDLIVEHADGRLFLCEIKSSRKVDERYARTLNSLSDSFDNAACRLLSCDPVTQQFDKVLALHWREGLAEICAS